MTRDIDMSGFVDVVSAARIDVAPLPITASELEAMAKKQVDRVNGYPNGMTSGDTTMIALLRALADVYRRIEALEARK